jgi:dethiobiotin synthetase
MAAIGTLQGLRGLFVTGTDTGVGKTFVTAAIARGLVAAGHAVGALKPVATGAVPRGADWHCEDAEALIDALGGWFPRERVAPILFEDPVAPPLAARRAGRPLVFDRVLGAAREGLSWWAAQGAGLVLVEGVGGLLCPLAEGKTVADLAIALDFPLVIVARRDLGTLNHTLLTVEAALGRGLRVAGVVLNDAAPVSHPIAAADAAASELLRYLDEIAILIEIPHHPGSAWLHERIACVNWFTRGMASRLFDPLDSAGSRS